MQKFDFSNDISPLYLVLPYVTDYIYLSFRNELNFMASSS